MTDPADGLAPLARLALAYAPERAQPSWQTILRLDARLAGVVRSAREPVLAQLRLAWWRERLGEDPATWPPGEPLLARLRDWGHEARALIALVDGWEALLGDAPLPAAALEDFAAGRADAMATLARRMGRSADAARRLGREWALADLTLHLGHPAERSEAAALLGEGRLPVGDRVMRPLAVLSGLCLRAVRRGCADPLDGPGALWAAIRLGILSNSITLGAGRRSE